MNPGRTNRISRAIAFLILCHHLISLGNMWRQESTRYIREIGIAPLHVVLPLTKQFFLLAIAFLILCHHLISLGNMWQQESTRYIREIGIAAVHVVLPLTKQFFLLAIAFLSSAIISSSQSPR